MNGHLCFIGLAIILYSCSTTSEQDARRRVENQRKFKDWRFKDYIQKYDPRTVWERVDKAQHARGSTSKKYNIDAMFYSMDITDDLLKLRVQNIGPPLEGTKLQDGRRWQPSKELAPHPKDRFDLRVRIYELMRQAIYQARNAMIIMQIMREKYRNSSLYKMGFLICKTDNAVKTFSQFAFRIFRQCGMTRAGASKRMFLFDTLATEERLLNLWFNIQLLVELINRNDFNCNEQLKKNKTDLIKNWKFED